MKSNSRKDAILTQFIIMPAQDTLPKPEVYVLNLSFAHAEFIGNGFLRDTVKVPSPQNQTIALGMDILFYNPCHLGIGIIHSTSNKKAALLPLWKSWRLFGGY